MFGEFQSIGTIVRNGYIGSLVKKPEKQIIGKRNIGILAHEPKANNNWS